MNYKKLPVKTRFVRSILLARDRNGTPTESSKHRRIDEHPRVETPMSGPSPLLRPFSGRLPPPKGKQNPSRYRLPWSLQPPSRDRGSDSQHPWEFLKQQAQWQPRPQV